MKLLINAMLVLMLSSCATAGPWKPCGPAISKQTWRHCDESIDGIDKHQKGFCYVDKECRTKYLRDYWRQNHLFCKYGDIPCMKKHKIFDKILVPKN